MIAKYSANPTPAKEGDYVPLAVSEHGMLYVRLADRLNADLDSVGFARAYITHTIGVSKDSDISDPFDARAYSSAALYLPLGWDGTSVYFETARELGAPYFVAYDRAGALLTATVGENRAVILPDVLIGMGIVRIRSGTPGAPVAQTALRELHVACKG